jgi:hypothetical protein
MDVIAQTSKWFPATPTGFFPGFFVTLAADSQRF